MSLDWSLGKVENYETRCWKPEEEVTSRGESRLQNDTQALIWGAMFLDLASITEKNVDEWEWRVEFCKRLGINWMVPPEYYVDRQSIVDHIGLSTNVTTKQRLTWMRKIMKQIERETNETMRRKHEDRKREENQPRLVDQTS